MTDYLPTAALLRLLAVMALVLAPHALHLPAWESTAVMLVLAWRATAAWRSWALPPRAFKLLLALAGFAAVYASHGRINGQAAGVALLVLMLALKLTEMRSRRDVMTVVFLMYFVMVTHFLHSQELWTVLYLLACAIAITMVLIDAQHPRTPLPLRRSLRLGSVLVMQALPLMLLLFVLFPRIPGPLWGLPSDAGAARSGLSDSMSPGDVAALSLSDEVVFRVRFEGGAPPPSARYWRGPVFRHFDGRTWTAPPADTLDRRVPQIEALGEVVRYELTLEPQRERWLFALDLPDPRALPPRTRLDAGGALVHERPLTERRLVQGLAYTRYRLDATLDAQQLQRDLVLPAQRNPQTLALARRWREETPDPEQRVARALRMFREQAFHYTLRPPRLGRQPVDEFLFDTRRGYCEHYASAFAVLMRASGIPARIVTGYHGAQANLFGGYHVVRQSDAHAWTEVWIQARGWVRVDPTSAIAPERIERDTRQALRGGEAVPGLLGDYQRWKYRLEARWDSINARWNEWVLAYGPEVQMRFLERFGLADLQRMILALTAGITALLALVGLAALRRMRPAPMRDRALKLWQRAQRRLARAGYVQAPEEGPRDFMLRVMQREPQWSQSLRALLDAYLRLRYGGEQNPALEREFAATVKRIKRRSG